jgi:hypothetical protein
MFTRARERWVRCAAACGLLGLAALPASARAEEGLLDGYVLYGITGDSNELIRYQFANGGFETIGQVRFADEQVALGIKGMALIPGNLNLYGFWADPSDGLTSLVYINSETAAATVVGADLGPGEVTGATIAWLQALNGDLNNGHGNDCDGIDEQNPGNSTGVNLNGMGNGAHSGEDCAQYLGVFALQTIEAQEEAPVAFRITGGRVAPEEQFAAKVTVLGAAITAGGAYDVPVTLSIKVGNMTIEPLGNSNKPVDANVNDGNNPRSYILAGTYGAGTEISVKGTSWIKKSSSYSGLSNTHWKVCLSKDSSTDSPNIKVLRNGDPVPSIQPFMNQSTIESFVRDYVDLSTHTMVLDENQAIFLFELGTTDLDSAAADFQDLVVLVTLARDPADLLNDADDDDGSSGPASRLIQVDPATGGYEQLMTLNNVYDGLTATADGTMYATKGMELWMLDVYNQTETLVGAMPATDVMGFESAGATFCGFSVQSGKLVPIDILTGASVAADTSVGVSDLQTIVFTEAEQISPSVASYD